MTTAGQRLTVARDAAGAFMLDAAMLAGRFGWSPEELRDMMRRGLVSSRVERGEGDDRGRWRLSVRCGNRRWRAIVEPDGTVAHQRVDFIPLRKASARE
ncbi:hypothetical protein FHS82_003602 [Pseudochelatococcus lubricantis]|uniref:DUF4258 domain-containing protein n=1 Tax=Pseudochelatococcus lubricantis TaxID=1538102 RepID=A0ABX0V3E8_9HYPH|nr:DUF6522 family protein [Pseudochelatococcus lubricantis]NIJ59741.1 hypothetical protein [Pseudochelatococcus lubricantis]